MYKLIALDMDGTLLNPEGQISPPTRDAIAAARHALAGDRVRSFLADMGRLGFEKEELLSLLRQEMEKERTYADSGM